MNKEIATITTVVINNPLCVVDKGLLLTSLFCPNASEYISLLIIYEGMRMLNYFCMF